jgi:hypothetical protein
MACPHQVAILILTVFACPSGAIQLARINFTQPTPGPTPGGCENATFSDLGEMPDVDYITGTGLLQASLPLQVTPLRCAWKFVRLESSPVIFTGADGGVARVNTEDMTVDVNYSAIDDRTVVGHSSSGKTTAVTVSFMMADGSRRVLSMKIILYHPCFPPTARIPPDTVPDFTYWIGSGTQSWSVPKFHPEQTNEYVRELCGEVVYQLSNFNPFGWDHTFDNESMVITVYGDPPYTFIPGLYTIVAKYWELARQGKSSHLSQQQASISFKFPTPSPTPSPTSPAPTETPTEGRPTIESCYRDSVDIDFELARVRKKSLGNGGSLLYQGILNDSNGKSVDLEVTSKEGYQQSNGIKNCGKNGAFGRIAFAAGSSVALLFNFVYTETRAPASLAHVDFTFYDLDGVWDAESIMVSGFESYYVKPGHELKIDDLSSSQVRVTSTKKAIKGDNPKWPEELNNYTYNGETVDQEKRAVMFVFADIEGFEVEVDIAGSGLGKRQLLFAGTSPLARFCGN